MTDVIVLRPGELFLKRGNRPFFERRLEDAVRRVLAGVSARVIRIHGRVLVEVGADDGARAAERLARVFGIVSLSPARLAERELEALAAAAVDVTRTAVARRAPRKLSFKVETSRADKSFPLPSPEVSAEIGARIIDALGLPVDVHHPDLTVGVEIGAERSFAYAETIPGPGGLPTGSTGLCNLLLSGGIDSPVAGWLIGKRGCTLAATYFHSFPYTGDRTKEKVISLCRLLTPWVGPMILHVVNFTDVQKSLRQTGRAELAVVLYRRMMLRAAAAVARRIGAQALVTGDNLAQVASQTLENLTVIEEASPLPVLRPLLCFDKVETIAIARRIGTYDTSVLPYEDCCSLFVPPHPATRARLTDIAEAESHLDVAALAAELAEKAEAIPIEG
jgi:tRNA uracil 4-sulfurtransferase